MTRYTYTTCLSFGTDGEADYCEVDATVSFAVVWGRPETPPSYAHGGLPADPDEINDIRVEAIDGRPVVTGDRITLDAIEHEFAMGLHDADLLETARYAAVADAERADEQRREWTA